MDIIEERSYQKEKKEELIIRKIDKSNKYKKVKFYNIIKYKDGDSERSLESSQRSSQEARVKKVRVKRV